jgi:hypothetical protein
MPSGDTAPAVKSHAVSRLSAAVESPEIAIMSDGSNGVSAEALPKVSMKNTFVVVAAMTTVARSHCNSAAVSAME